MTIVMAHRRDRTFGRRQIYYSAYVSGSYPLSDIGSYTCCMYCGNKDRPRGMLKCLRFEVNRLALQPDRHWPHRLHGWPSNQRKMVTNPPQHMQQRGRRFI